MPPSPWILDARRRCGSRRVSRRPAWRASASAMRAGSRPTTRGILVLDPAAALDDRAAGGGPLRRRSVPAARRHRVGRAGARLRGRDAGRRRAPGAGGRDGARPPGDRGQRDPWPHARHATRPARLRPQRRGALAARERRSTPERWARSSPPAAAPGAPLRPRSKQTRSVDARTCVSVPASRHRQTPANVFRRIPGGYG